MSDSFYHTFYYVIIICETSIFSINNNIVSRTTHLIYGVNIQKRKFFKDKQSSIENF